MERYRKAKVTMYAYIDVLVHDSESEDEQKEKMEALARDFVDCAQPIGVGVYLESVEMDD